MNRLFPRVIDNNYAGHRAAIWILVPVVALKTVIAFNSVFFTRMVAAEADGIPLDSFPAAAVRQILDLFAILGLAHLILQGLSVLVLVRYRSVLPLVYVALLVEQLGRKLILWMKSPEWASTATSSVINWGLVAAMLLGLSLSLRRLR